MGIVRRTVTCVSLGVGIWLCLASSAMGATAPFIGLTPSSGVAGSAFTITWSGFTQCSVFTFTWAGAPLTSASPGTSKGSVGATVPPDAKPGTYLVVGTCGREVARAPFTVTGTTTTTPPPPTTTTTTPTTVTVTTVTTTNGKIPPPTTVTTTTAPTTTTTPPTTDSTPPPVTDVSEPTGNGLVLDHGSIQPGDPLSASGTGCEPGHAVTLTSGGEQVGTAVADSSGHFTTPVEFTRIDPGRHVVTADCGVVLTGVVDQVITSSTGDHSGTLIVLVFFVLAGAAMMRFV